MPRKPITWFCVADAGHARIKEATVLTAPLPTVTTLRHDVYEHGRYEEAGKGQESATSARHGFQDAEGPIRRDKRDFAHLVADYLNDAAMRGAFQRLMLAAPPKFLGDLRAALGTKARGMIAGEIHKDLTKESDAELAARVAEVPTARG
ncbi:MAG TPA: host attachment protein [Alphaproteobacteria bacterium]|jgi:protein required for attachment to host cells